MQISTINGRNYVRVHLKSQRIDILNLESDTISLWVFSKVHNGVEREVRYAQQMGNIIPTNLSVIERLEHLSFLI